MSEGSAELRARCGGSHLQHQIEPLEPQSGSETGVPLGGNRDLLQPLPGARLDLVPVQATPLQLQVVSALA